MSISVRIAGVILLLIVVGICAFLMAAAREAPRETRWAFWTIEGAVGLACAAGAAWLLSAKREQVQGG